MFASASSRATICSFRRQCSAAIPAAATVQINRCRFQTGTVFSFSRGAFFIAEASYLPNQNKDARGLPGAYRVGAWYHTGARFADQRFDDTGLALANPQSTGIAMEHAGDGGVYGVIDQMLYRVPGTDDQGLSGFVRAGGVPQDRNLINFYADGGLLYKGLVPHRPDDKIGVATAVARVGGIPS